MNRIGFFKKMGKLIKYNMAYNLQNGDNIPQCENYMIIRSFIFLIAIVLFVVWGYFYFILSGKGLVHFLLLLSNISLLVGILYQKRLS